jgi:beta-N-acetylhexosaminidase
MPAAARFGELHRCDPDGARWAAKVTAQGLGQRLRTVGINTNCAPCLDVPVEGADPVIGDRAYARETDVVADLGRAVAAGYLAAGVVPVIKHIPGHGRAAVDSHKSLPVVSASRADLGARDFAPFRALKDMPAAMSAHVTFEAIDSGSPASTSERVTQDIIRGEIGFDGLLMSDDISMGALAGGIGARAGAVLAAGSDIALHCNGVLAEMIEVAACVPRLAGASQARFEHCVGITEGPVEQVDDEVFRRALDPVRGGGEEDARNV